ncbi:MAG: hypothetical protein Q9165_003921 [Trypethelium subeluteriae]
MGLTDRLRSFLEHRRLENRYLNRSKRNTFTSNAEYHNGEYVHSSPPTFPTPVKPNVTPKSTRQLPAHPSPFYAASSSPTFSYYRRTASSPASPTSLSQPSPTIAETCEAEVGSPTALPPTPRVRAFQSEPSDRRRRRWSAFVGSTGSEGLGWEGEGEGKEKGKGKGNGGEGGEEQRGERQRKERRRMSAVGEGGVEERDGVEADGEGGLRMGSGQGGQDSWLQRRRRSMLGRI